MTHAPASGLSAPALLLLAATQALADAAATPQLSPAGGVHAVKVLVTLTCATPDATIHYTDNGADPTPSDTPLSSGGTVMVVRPQVLKALCTAPGHDPSAITRADYIVTGAISVGGSHVMALKANGQVYAWGQNSRGQLGNNSTAPSTTPVHVSGLPGASGLATDAEYIVAISAGHQHSLALTNLGTVYAWGDDSQQQLGYVTPASPNNRSLVPQGVTANPPPSGVTIIDVSAGEYHSLALRSDGRVRGWGDNAFGQIGDATNTDRPEPVDIAAFTSGVTQVAAGEYHSVALRVSGGNQTVYTWGSNADGELGSGSLSPGSRNTPAVVSGVTFVTDIAAGPNFSLALQGTGPGSLIWGWGSDTYGQIGTGTACLPCKRPAPVGTVSDARDIAGGSFYTQALMPDGALRGWGLNSNPN